MALIKVFYLFNSVNTGGYDKNGQWYGPSNDLVTSNGYVNERVFYAFNSAAIYQAENGLVTPTVTLTYTLSNSDISTQVIDVGAFFLNANQQALVDADTTNSAGATFSNNAQVFSALDHIGTVTKTDVKDTSVTASIDITGTVSSAYHSVNSSGGRSGGPAFLASIPETYVSFTPSGTDSGFTYVSNVTATLTGYVAIGTPTISGTVSNQIVYPHVSTTPFSNVKLTDPGNPSGAGDEITITVLNAYGYAKDYFGTLYGTGLIDYGSGNYELTPTTSVATLQDELESLQFVPNIYTGRVILELDYQAGDSNTVDNILTTLTITNPACYAAGTLLMTDKAEKSVEALAVGDVVVTAAGEPRAVKWIGRRSYAGRFLRANPGVQPVRFRAGCLGDGLPRRDLLVSPEHAMFLDDVLVPARCLVNGTTIVRERDLDRIDYFHVELDSHDVLLAEGAPSESFMDDDSRGVFHNASEFAVLYPDAPKPDGFCAPRIEQGAQLEAIRQRLAVMGGMAQAA